MAKTKTLYVNQEYIDNNFDETGLGINLCTGLRFATGQTVLLQLMGLFDVGYGKTIM